MQLPFHRHATFAAKNQFRPSCGFHLRLWFVCEKDCDCAVARSPRAHSYRRDCALWSRNQPGRYRFQV